jgi:hypothetical protein
LNAESVAGAVKADIDHKMSDLAKSYRETYRDIKDPAILDDLRKSKTKSQKSFAERPTAPFCG